MRRWHEEHEAPSMRRAINTQQRSESSFREGYAGMPGLYSEDLAGKRNVAAAYSREGGYAGYAKADITQSTVNLVTCVLGQARWLPLLLQGVRPRPCDRHHVCDAGGDPHLVPAAAALRAAVHSQDIRGIAESALGRGGRTLLELCIAAMNLGALVAFLDILADVLSAVAGTIIPPGAEPSRHAYITGVTVVGRCRCAW
ncbi:hypothetical protein COO60DRAFT_912483 [Scenedesmus sp. NREL 46B-D3]|nr:hypothetical protein COO60DRAFT_912483 [Scenedesmus sp. NREL 46B-D3]